MKPERDDLRQLVSWLHAGKPRMSCLHAISCMMKVMNRASYNDSEYRAFVKPLEDLKREDMDEVDELYQDDRVPRDDDLATFVRLSRDKTHRDLCLRVIAAMKFKPVWLMTQRPLDLLPSDARDVLEEHLDSLYHDYGT